MRVLHVLCDLSPGGAEHLVLELCRRRSPGVEVEVATVFGGGPLEAPLREVGASVSVGSRRRARVVAPTLARLVGAVQRADVVHTHLFAGDTWGRVAAVLARHPAVVTTEHNVNRDESWEIVPKRALARVSRRVVCVSEAVARHTREVERIAAPIEVIPNGVDVDRFRPVERPPRRGVDVRLLAVGRRVPQKGFDVLLDALPPGVRVRIAGEGPFAPAHPQVDWLGYVADPAPLYADADILVVPSRWEGFGLAAAEGMAAGLAVVASAVDALVDVVGEAGILVPPERPDALRDALAGLLDAPERRHALGRAARARVVERYSLDAMVRAYEALYATVLAETRRS